MLKWSNAQILGGADTLDLQSGNSVQRLFAAREPKVLAFYDSKKSSRSTVQVEFLRAIKPFLGHIRAYIGGELEGGGMQ